MFANFNLILILFLALLFTALISNTYLFLLLLLYKQICLGKSSCNTPTLVDFKLQLLI